MTYKFPKKIPWMLSEKYNTHDYVTNTCNAGSVTEQYMKILLCCEWTRIWQSGKISPSKMCKFLWLRELLHCDFPSAANLSLASNLHCRHFRNFLGHILSNCNAWKLDKPRRVIHQPENLDPKQYLASKYPTQKNTRLNKYLNTDLLNQKRTF